jgi:hypothetical protein
MSLALIVARIVNNMSGPTRKPIIKTKAIRAYFHHGQVDPCVVTKNKARPPGFRFPIAQWD